MRLSNPIGKQTLIYIFLMISAGIFGGQTSQASSDDCSALLVRYQKNFRDELNQAPPGLWTRGWRALRGVFSELPVREQLDAKLGEAWEEQLNGVDRLVLPDMELTDKQLFYIAKEISNRAANTLKRVDLSLNPSLTDKGLVALFQAVAERNLIHLDLYRTGASAYIVKDLYNIHPRITRLVLAEVNADTLSQLTRFTRLNYLDLTSARLRFRKMRNITHASISAEDIAGFIASTESKRFRRLILPFIPGGDRHSRRLLNRYRSFREKIKRAQQGTDLKVDWGGDFYVVSFSGQLSDVYDGDSPRFTIYELGTFFDGGEIRILGIDTAEMKTADPFEKKMALAARNRLYQMLLQCSRFQLWHAGPDKYGKRIVADVRCLFNGRWVSLGMDLLSLGLAREYDGGTKGGQSWKSLYERDKKFFDELIDLYSEEGE